MINTAASRTARLSVDGISTSKWLPRVRAVWLALIVVVFITFVFSIRGTYRMLTTVCDPALSTCEWSQATPETVATLDRYGISLEAAALYHLILFVTVSLVFWGSGLLVLYHRSRDWHGLLVSYLLITVGAGGVSLVFLSGMDHSGLPAAAAAVAGLTIFPVYLAMSLFFLTFPDGRVYPRWTRVTTLLILANYATWLAPGHLNIQYWPSALAGLWLMFVFGSHVAVQGYRYRRYYNQEQRQQTKWLVFGFSSVLVLLLIFTSLNNLLLNGMLEGTFVVFLYLPIALAVTVAILRYRLWDIDILINRTLLYTSLTALVVALYVIGVGALSAVFKSGSDNMLISLGTTGLIAVSFQPLRGYLQRIVDRVTYGERHNPYEVISRLSERLEANISPGTLLPSIAETIAQTLKLPYVSIGVGDGGSLRTEAVFGLPPDRGRFTALPLIYAQETVGQMIIGQAAGDRALDGAERRLVDNVARQTGIAVHAVQLNRELRQSRQHIVTAREEERRRLRRDLHDGLGPSLASHTLKLGAARALIESDPHTAAAILSDLEDSLAESLTDIRRLVYNLRPPVLDQLGLVGALRDLVEQYQEVPADRAVGFDLCLPASASPIAAAVEVAAYRIAQEAVNNVVRHAQARHCEITLEIGDALELTVTDGGKGLPDDVTRGVGLTSMRERAEELGGTLTVERQPVGGTRLHVRIPL